MRGIFSHIFWKVFDGDAKEDSRIQTKEEFNNSSTVFSLEFSHVMGYSMWAMYQGITVILLINILIAQVSPKPDHKLANCIIIFLIQMNSTYLRVWENADAEWKYSKSFFQVGCITSVIFYHHHMHRFSFLLQGQSCLLHSDGFTTLQD